MVMPIRLVTVAVGANAPFDYPTSSPRSLEHAGPATYRAVLRDRPRRRGREGLDSVEDAVQAEGEWVDRRRGAGECFRQCGKVFDMAVDEFDGEPLPLLRVVGVEVDVLLGEVARVSGDEQEDLVALDSLQTVDSSAASAASIQWSRCGPRS